MLSINRRTTYSKKALIYDEPSSYYKHFKNDQQNLKYRSLSEQNRNQNISVDNQSLQKESMILGDEGVMKDIIYVNNKWSQQLKELTISNQNLNASQLSNQRTRNMNPHQGQNILESESGQELVKNKGVLNKYLGRSSLTNKNKQLRKIMQGNLKANQNSVNKESNADLKFLLTSKKLKTLERNQNFKPISKDQKIQLSLTKSLEQTLSTFNNKDQASQILEDLQTEVGTSRKTQLHNLHQTKDSFESLRKAFMGPSEKESKLLSTMQSHKLKNLYHQSKMVEYKNVKPTQMKFPSMINLQIKKFTLSSLGNYNRVCEAKDKETKVVEVTLEVKILSLPLVYKTKLIKTIQPQSNQGIMSLSWQKGRAIINQQAVNDRTFYHKSCKILKME
eukprot:403339511